MIFFKYIYLNITYIIHSLKKTIIPMLSTSFCGLNTGGDKSSTPSKFLIGDGHFSNGGESCFCISNVGGDRLSSLRYSLNGDTAFSIGGCVDSGCGEISENNNNK